MTESSSRAPRAFPWRPVLAFMTGWALLFWGIIGFFVAPVLPGGWLAVLGLGALGLAPLGVFLRGMLRGAYPGSAMRLLVMRPFWYTQLALPLVAGGALVGAIVGLAFGAPMAGGRSGAAVTLAVYVLGALAGWLGSRRLVVRRLDVRLEGLAPALDGMRIAQLTDLHVGPHTSRRFLGRVVDAVRAAQPDLIAYTGDQVDDFPEDVTHFGRALGALTAPLGVYAIAGNHDVYAGWPAVRAGLERLGIIVLVNDAVRRERDGASFWIAGTGDPAGGRGGQLHAAPDIARTMAGVAPDELSIVLAHNPALWPALVRRGAHLTLSGHTHHGQLSIPRLGWSLASPFLEHAMGIHREGDSHLYIAPGTNFWGIPFRLGAYPEVTILTLRRAEPERAGIVEREVAPVWCAHNLVEAA
jgi:predicted MPP superfamily phosphohydrolase